MKELTNTDNRNGMGLNNTQCQWQSAAQHQLSLISLIVKCEMLSQCQVQLTCHGQLIQQFIQVNYKRPSVSVDPAITKKLNHTNSLTNLKLGTINIIECDVENSVYIKY
jgi:hypothetical protein